MALSCFIDRLLYDAYPHECTITHLIHSPVSRLHTNRTCMQISLCGLLHGTPNILGFTPIESQTFLPVMKYSKDTDDIIVYFVKLDQ